MISAASRSQDWEKRFYPNYRTTKAALSFAAGQLAVSQGASEVPLSGS
jgi:hypothetical protein